MPGPMKKKAKTPGKPLTIHDKLTTAYKGMMQKSKGKKC